jgi:pimeloyl-ACP methyl ester carboxylesterase
MATWYEQRGEGDSLVLLHPGMADARAFDPNVDALAARFHVYTPERRGHGRTPDLDGPITYEGMARDTVDFVETIVGGPAHLLGCSDGAIVALVTALLRPELVRRLVLVAGVFHRDGWHPSAVNWPDGLDPDSVSGKMARMHSSEPTLTVSDLARVRSRTLVMVGDDDEVSLEHAAELYGGLPDGELAVVPGTSHGLLVEKPALCNTMVLDFLTNDPVPQMAPIRRASLRRPCESSSRT